MGAQMIKTSGVSQQLEDIIARRREKLPLVDAQVQDWERLATEIAGLNQALEELEAHHPLPPELSAAIREFRARGLSQGIAEAIARLRIVHGRMARETI